MRVSRVQLLTFTYLWNSINAFVQVENLPQPLLDGILVAEPQDIGALGGIWTVLVVIEEPRVPSALINEVNMLAKRLDHAFATTNLSAATRQLWTQRIAELKQSFSLRPAKPSTRTKRGLLNFVGQISETLFGTAREQEVRACQEQLRNAALNQQRVLHLIKQLTTIVNSSRAETAINRIHINSIQAFLKKFVTHTYDKTIGTIAEAISQQGKGLLQLALQLQFESEYSRLESAHVQWQRLTDKYSRQRSSLELGRLTEDILPPADLNVILAAARQRGLITPAPQWYYQHVKITPLWEETDRLVFRAALPLMEDTRYLKYVMRSWPIPRQDANYTIQIQVPSAVAMDTGRGNMFKPHSCIGANPSVCQTGPVYNTNRLLCARSIINGDKTNHQLCRVIVRDAAETMPIEEEVTPGIFVIYSPGEDYRINCPGQSEVMKHLNKGTHVFKVKNSCKINGQFWTISGLYHYNSTLRQVSFFKVKPLNLLNITSSKTIKLHFDKTPFRHMSQLPEMPILKLNSVPPFDESPEVLARLPTVNSNWVTSLITSLIFVLVFLCGYLLKKRLFIRKTRDSGIGILPSWNDRPKEAVNVPMAELHKNHDEIQN